MVTKEDIIETAQIYATFFGKAPSARSEFIEHFEGSFHSIGKKYNPTKVQYIYSRAPTYSVYHFKYKELVHITQYCDLDSVMNLLALGSGFVFNAAVMGIMANLDGFKAKLEEQANFWSDLEANEAFQESKEPKKHLEHLRELLEKSKSAEYEAEAQGLTEITRNKGAQATIHLLLMLIEPKQSPYHNNYIGIRVEGTSCYKPQYLDRISVALSTAGKELVNSINLNRCTEDTYLEVTELKDDWLKP